MVRRKYGNYDVIVTSKEMILVVVLILKKAAYSYWFWFWFRKCSKEGNWFLFWFRIKPVMHVGFDFVVRNLHNGTYWLWFRVSELGFARLWPLLMSKLLLLLGGPEMTAFGHASLQSRLDTKCLFFAEKPPEWKLEQEWCQVCFCFFSPKVFPCACL